MASAWPCVSLADQSGDRLACYRVIFSQLARAVEFITQPLIAGFRSAFDYVFPQRGIDIDGNGVCDFKVPRHPILFYPKELLPGFLMGLSVQLVAAAVFVHVEGWPFGTAMYHCMVTSTTVGYGDTPITTAAGRAAATIHILLSVHPAADDCRQSIAARRFAARPSPPLPSIASPSLTRGITSSLAAVKVSIIMTFINEVDHAIGRRRRAQRKLKLIKAECDVDLLVSLDKNGDGTDKGEFVVGLLVEVGALRWEDAAPFMALFDKIALACGNQTGKLTRDELAQAETVVADQAERVRAITGGGDELHDLIPTFSFLQGGDRASKRHSQVESVGARLWQSPFGGARRSVVVNEVGSAAGPDPTAQEMHSSAI